MTLANIYGPNSDDPFFIEISLTFECEEIILERQKRWEHEKSWQKMKYIVVSLDLTDIWRFLNADTKTFTWRRRNPEI